MVHFVANAFLQLLAGSRLDGRTFRSRTETWQDQLRLILKENENKLLATEEACRPHLL
jgi:hypothetical protein